MKRHDIRNTLIHCADMYEERANAYAPDPNFPEEALSMTAGFLEDLYGQRHAGKHKTRYIVPAYMPDEVALWANVGQKVARLRTRGIPGYGESNKTKEEFIDDAEDLIVFLAMGICKIKDSFDMEQEEEYSPLKEDMCGLTV